MKRIICAILSVIMLMIPLTASFSSVAAEDNTAVTLEEQLKELARKNNEYQKALDSIQNNINKKEEYKQALLSRMEVLSEKMSLTQKKIDELNKNLKETQEEIDRGNADIEDQISALCQRIRTIYMAGSASDLEIILGAKDFSDFIDKMNLVSTLSKYDKKLIDEINVKLEKVTADKEKLLADKADLEEQKKSFDEDSKEMNSLAEENDELLKELYKTSEDAQLILDGNLDKTSELKKEIEEYNKTIRKKQEEEAKKKKAEEEAKRKAAQSSTTDKKTETTAPTKPKEELLPVVSGEAGYMWPLPGYYYITAPFGEDRTSYSHGGIDIGCSYGATVIAADGGVVVTAWDGCNHNYGKDGNCCSSYGNVITIDHGNGKKTIYGHLTSLNVKVGDIVKKGQVIATSGSTGHSTGPHLHFECRLNDVKYDPRLEFPVGTAN